MKLFVNIYNLCSENEYKEKGMGLDILYTDKVYKEDDKFFMEINGKEFIVPSKNGLVKSKSSNIVLLNEKELELLTKIKN